MFYEQTHPHYTSLHCYEIHFSEQFAKFAVCWQIFSHYKRILVSEMEMSKAFHNFNRTVVRSNSLYGRYLIAGSDTKANELLVEELPLVHGPKCNGPTVCLECYNRVKLEGCVVDQRCSKCSWPLCSSCSDKVAPYHRRWECSVFCQAKAKFYPVQCEANVCPQLDCITVLR